HRAGGPRAHRPRDRRRSSPRRMGGPPGVAGRHDAGQGRLTMPVVLETERLEKHFGGIAAVAGVSLKIEKGARHALIGPNGAGKTTVVNLLTGVLKPSAGRILLEGEDITSLEAYKRAQRGLAR